MNEIQFGFLPYKINLDDLDENREIRGLRW